MRKRCVFTNSIGNNHAFKDYEEGVYCVIGPFGDFSADPEFQDELEDLCRRYNLKHGHLSQEKYDLLRQSHS